MSPPEYRSVVRRLGPSAVRLALATFALGAGVASFVHTAFAQTNEAVAESLFRDGKRLFQADDFEHACPKLAQSYQIDPAGGTVLLLAICYEKQGRFASSWARYNDALASARRDQRDDRERRAREGLASVEPKLSYLVLKLDPATQAIAGVKLAIDGADLPIIADAKLPIDPGPHTLAVHAPNYETWQSDITITGPSTTQNVAVPPLQAKPAAPPVSAAPAPASAPVNSPLLDANPPSRERAENKNMRLVAYVMGGAGLAAVAVGSYFGVRAITLKNDANAICSAKQCLPSQAAAVPKSEDAVSSAHLADAFIGIGSAVTISAAVLWYAYRNDPPDVAPYAFIAPHAVSLGWRQSF
jgi:tetratricopeptide (TPR) repeat protein